MYNGEHSFSEDCLYLNVFTGAAGRDDRRPVLVWLHMGAFNLGWSGGPLYDGAGLAAAGAVVVTVNYRLGRFGFLAHPALSAESSYGGSGNYGLMDQIAALQWIQSNIAAFGGDPSCVTIYGVSAGACAASILMASPAAKGLFHRIIAGSGGAFAPVSNGGTHFGARLQSLGSAEKSGVRVMKSRGAETAEEMRALPAHELVEVLFGPRADFLETAYPIIDGCVLPRSPWEVFADGQQNDVPLITGSNGDEHLPGYVDRELFARLNRPLLGEAFDDLGQIYAMETEADFFASTGILGGDRTFTWQNWTWARLQAATGQNPVFYYHFSYEPPVPPGRYVEQPEGKGLGAAHSIELAYTWRNLAARDWPFTARDHQLSETMSNYWLHFMRSGEPNGPSLPEWPRFDPAAPKLLHFDVDGQPAPVSAPALGLERRMAFWDAVNGLSFEENVQSSRSE